MSAVTAGAATESPELRIPLPPGPVGVGTNAHKVLFCRTLLDTFNPYKPAIIDWPALDEDARRNLFRHVRSN